MSMQMCMVMQMWGGGVGVSGDPTAGVQKYVEKHFQYILLLCLWLEPRWYRKNPHRGSMSLKRSLTESLAVQMKEWRGN